MSRFISCAFDSRAAREFKERTLKAFERAATQAVREVTKETERALESAGQQAGLGKLAKAWDSRVYPRGDSLNAAGTVYVKGGERSRGAMRSHTEGSTIRPKSSRYIVVPLPAAGKAPRGQRMTPDLFMARTGIKLQFVPPSGRRPAMLVATGKVGKTGKVRGGTERQRKTGNGLSSTPVFLLVSQVRQAGKFSVEDITRKHAAKLPAIFADKLRQARTRSP